MRGIILSHRFPLPAGVIVSELLKMGMMSSDIPFPAAGKSSGVSCPYLRSSTLFAFSEAFRSQECRQGRQAGL